MWLSIDTSTEAFSVALGDQVDIVSRYQIAPRQHGELLLKTLDELIKEAELHTDDVKGVVYGKGPGAFTGIRIAVSAAQGLGFGFNCPLIGVSSLQSIAYQVFTDTHAKYAIVANDARMNEVYFAVYQRKVINGNLSAELLGEESVAPPYEFSLEDLVKRLSIEPENSIGAGSGWPVYGDSLQHQFSSLQISKTEYFPHAKSNLQLALNGDLQATAHPAELAVPSYLRNDVAKKSSKV